MNVFAPSGQHISAPIDDPRLLEDWDSLFEAMAVAVGADGSSIRRSLRRYHANSRRGMSIFMAFSSILAMFPVCGFIFGFMSFTGISPYFPIFVIVYVLGAVVAQAVFLVLAGRGKTDFSALLAPLGLAVTHSPDLGRAVASKAAGVAFHDKMVIEGQRTGRPIRIEIHGTETLTSIGGVAPAFTVSSAKGQFTLSPDAPEGVIQVLRTLRDPDRWKKLDMRVDGGVLTIQRRGSSTGTEWLTDLWLAERLATHAA
jgi:hypothetical protein